MIANIASATLPTIATRSASCGVSGGRRSSGGWIIASAERGIWPRRSDGRCSGLSPPVV